MLSMHERRKNVSSASVIWYTVLFRQNRTDRPILRYSGWGGVRDLIVSMATIYKVYKVWKDWKAGTRDQKASIQAHPKRHKGKRGGRHH